MRLCFAILVLLLCLIPLGCIVTPNCPPQCAMGQQCGQSCQPYGTTNPMRYSEDMHPTVAPDGALYLQPFSGLQQKINAPAE